MHPVRLHVDVLRTNATGVYAGLKASDSLILAADASKGRKSGNDFI